MSRLRWPDSTNSVSEKPGTIHHHVAEYALAFLKERSSSTGCSFCYRPGSE